jgi:hypothetical protein
MVVNYFQYLSGGRQRHINHCPRPFFQTTAYRVINSQFDSTSVVLQALDIEANDSQSMDCTHLIQTRCLMATLITGHPER